MSTNSENINFKEDSKKINQAKELIRAVDHELRRKILRYIHDHPNCCVKDIYKALDIEQSVVSQHLRILRTSNVVINTRQGKNILYKLNYDYAMHINNAINNFLKE